MLTFLGLLVACQRGGRWFAAELRSASAKRAKPASEPDLVLQKMKAPPRNSAEGRFAPGWDRRDVQLQYPTVLIP